MLAICVYILPDYQGYFINSSLIKGAFYIRFCWRLYCFLLKYGPMNSIIEGQTYNFTQEGNSFWEEHEVALFSTDYKGHRVLALTPAAQSCSLEKKNSFVLIARYQNCFQFSFLNSRFSYYDLIISKKAGSVKSVMIYFLFCFVFTTHLQVLNKILPN